MPVMIRCLAVLACIVVVGGVGAASVGDREGGTPAADQELARVGAALAKSRNCLACHQVDARRVGPPLASVGERYASDGGSIAATREYLAKSIREGGRGKWSAVPMPAQPQVSESEALTLADWVLSLAGSKR